MKVLCKLATRILLAGMLISLVFVSSVGAFSGEGEGTETNPYQITDVNQLQDMKDDLQAHYILMNDIDASDTVNWNDGAGFEPIGDYVNEFRGTFDGQGYVIHDLFINSPAREVGLFGVLYESLVKNVGLENIDVSAVSDDEYSISYVGGLVGANGGTDSNRGTISNCYVTGRVSGNFPVGGLVGYNHTATISNSHATVTVNGLRYVGGLVGTNSYLATVSNSYATGKVIGNFAGGLVGVNNGMVSSSFWDTETSGQMSSDGGTGKSTEEMMNIRTYTDTDWSDGLSNAWNMVLIQNYDNETWYIEDGNDYPRLGWQYDFPTYDVTFNVTDSDGAPLEGATVKLNGMEQTTGSDGSAKFEEVLPGSYTYEVSKDGYDTESGGIVVIDEDKTVNVTLYLTYRVEWLPPLTNLTEYTLRDGTTLPIKFQLIDRDGNIVEEVQEGIYLKIEDLETWELGDGGDALRFDDEDFHYIANFHTRNYDLEDEETYVAEVYDIYDNLLGSFAFEVDSERGTSRGRGR